MLGFLDGGPKYDVFKKSRLMVHPAIYDSGGMAAAEGMAWGLPGVSFDLEALQTYYPKGMLKTEPGDLDGFATNVLRLITDGECFRKTSLDALALVREHWDWRARTDDIYREVFDSDE